jgi:hypothetical protein
MKKFCTFLTASVVLFSLLLVGACGDSNPIGEKEEDNHFNPNITYGFFTDTRDDKKYRTIVVGTQTWLAENLNYSGSSGDIGVCYNYNSNNCAKYGRLYSWAEAMDIDLEYNNILCDGSDVGHQGICPVGWHIPSWITPNFPDTLSCPKF